jgi:hypothetical protein
MGHWLGRPQSGQMEASIELSFMLKVLNISDFSRSGLASRISSLSEIVPQHSPLTYHVSNEAVNPAWNWPD